MVNWTVTDPHTYCANMNGLELTVASAAYQTWSWLLSRDGRALKGGNARELDEAKGQAVEAAGAYTSAQGG
jgi:hypothetical protein